MTFDQFWAECRRKVGKLKAQEVYKTQIRKGYTDDELLAGLRRYNADCDLRNVGLEYICHPVTFLRQGRWLDEGNATIASGTDQLSRDATEIPADGYGSVIHRKLGDALFQAYFSGCEFKERFVIAPTAARRDYILNKFQYRLPDLDVRVQE